MERGFAPEVLAHSMTGAEITELANNRGVDVALQVLRALAEEIEQAGRSKPN